MKIETPCFFAEDKKEEEIVIFGRIFEPHHSTRYEWTEMGFEVKESLYSNSKELTVDFENLCKGKYVMITAKEFLDLRKKWTEDLTNKFLAFTNINDLP